MKRFLVVILILISNFIYGQCVGNQTFTLNPPPPAGGYTPGTVVTVCYTMNGWPGLNVGSNWLEGFDINLGSGWTNLQQMAAPANCGGGSGQWVWVFNNLTPNGAVGPGWFFDSGINGPLNGIPSDDWGDEGTTCVWSFCFQVTVANSCTPQSLLIQVTAGADGTWGNWINNSCPTVPFPIYNGVINTTLPNITNISHN
jgi:hypothetical protein